MYRLALDRIAAKGFVTVLPPVLVREEALYGTAISRPMRTASMQSRPTASALRTAEIPLFEPPRGEILDADELPLRYVAFSPCFRREAGAAGKDTRGMFRVHQFNKVEQFSRRRRRAVGRDELLLANTEELVQELGVPYRIVTLPRATSPPPTAKTYDVEIWFPSMDSYRETASVSNTTDFQARRLAIRYRDGKNLEPVHMLNGTAVVDRMALAVLENFGGDVPDVLREYGAPGTRRELTRPKERIAATRTLRDDSSWPSPSSIARRSSAYSSRCTTCRRCSPTFAMR